ITWPAGRSGLRPGPPPSRRSANSSTAGAGNVPHLVLHQDGDAEDAGDEQGKTARGQERLVLAADDRLGDLAEMPFPSQNLRLARREEIEMAITAHRRADGERLTEIRRNDVAIPRDVSLHRAAGQPAEIQGMRGLREAPVGEEHGARDDRTGSLLDRRISDQDVGRVPDPWNS